MEHSNTVPKFYELCAYSIAQHKSIDAINIMPLPQLLKQDLVAYKQHEVRINEIISAILKELELIQYELI